MTADLFVLLLLGHLVGDWIVQTDWQAANKARPDESWRRRIYHLGPITVDGPRHYANGAGARSWEANLRHILGYHIALDIAIMPLGNAITNDKWWTIFLISGISHAFIDRRWPVKWLCDRTGSSAFGSTAFGMIAVDQALHLSILCALAYGVGR